MANLSKVIDGPKTDEAPIKLSEVTFTNGAGSTDTTMTFEATTMDNQEVDVKLIFKDRKPPLCVVQGVGVPREKALLQQLQDVEGVAKILPSEDTESEYLLVTQRAPGSETLELVMMSRHQGMSEGLVRHFLKKVVTILREVNGRGITHGYVAEKNIMVDLATLEVYLTNFEHSYCSADGISVKLDAEASMYYPPEYFIRSVSPDGLTSWQLGVLAYFMLAGFSTPAGTKDMTKAMRMACWQEDPTISDCSNECKDFLASLLDQDDKMRSSVDDIADHPFMLQTEVELEFLLKEVHARSPTRLPVQLRN